MSPVEERLKLVVLWVVVGAHACVTAWKRAPAEVQRLPVRHASAFLLSPPFSQDSLCTCRTLSRLEPK